MMLCSTEKHIKCSLRPLWPSKSPQIPRKCIEASKIGDATNVQKDGQDFYASLVLVIYPMGALAKLGAEKFVEKALTWLENTAGMCHVYDMDLYTTGVVYGRYLKSSIYKSTLTILTSSFKSVKVLFYPKWAGLSAKGSVTLLGVSLLPFNLGTILWLTGWWSVSTRRRFFATQNLAFSSAIVVEGGPASQKGVTVGAL